MKPLTALSLLLLLSTQTHANDFLQAQESALLSLNPNSPETYNTQITQQIDNLPLWHSTINNNPCQLNPLHPIDPCAKPYALKLQILHAHDQIELLLLQNYLESLLLTNSPIPQNNNYNPYSKDPLNTQTQELLSCYLNLISSD